MKTRFKITSLILALFVAIFVTGTAFAWFTKQLYNMDIDGKSAGAYFAYGDGTSTKLDKDGNAWDGENIYDWDENTGPFGINNPLHMFNLAWLQNTGKFKEDNNHPDGKYYFELASDVDMSSLGRNVVLPPIGNSEYPFRGEFNGQGHTISNLIISTNKDVLYGNPATPGYKFSNAVGLFGMTANIDSANGNYCVIKNFILAYPTVEVAKPKDENGDGVNTDYEGIDESIGEENVVGLAVGYASGKVQSIGVLGGILAVRRIDYSTINSIIGNLSEDALKNENNNLTGNGSGGGENTGNKFGSNFNITGIYARMKDIADNNKQSWKLPNVDVTRNPDGSIKDVNLAELEKIPFTISSANYEGADAAEVISEYNIGYMLGNEIETYVDDYKFGEPIGFDGNWTYSDSTTPNTQGVIPKWVYKTDPDDTWLGETEYSKLIPLKKDDMEDLPADVLKMIYYDDNTNEFSLDSIKMNSGYPQGIHLYPDGNKPQAVHWGMHGQIEVNGEKYGKGIERNTYAADENGAYYAGTYGAGGWTLLTDIMLDEIDNKYYMFKYDDDGFNNYAAARNSSEVLVLTDGTVKPSWTNDWVYTADKARTIPFNAFDDYYFYNNKFYYDEAHTQVVMLYDFWGNGYEAEPIEGTPVPLYGYNDGIALPNNGFWFKPTEPGTIRLLMFGDKKLGHAGIAFLKIKRPTDPDNPDNPFYIDTSINGTCGLTIAEEIQYTLPNNILVLIELEYDINDINAGYEFWITKSNGGASPFFIYMDIGANSSGNNPTPDENKDTSIAKPDLMATAIDFIYDGIKILDHDIADESGKIIIPKGSFVDESDNKYVETGTMLSFGTTGAIVSFYYRKDEQPDSDGYTINAAYNATGNSLKSSNTSKANITTTGTDVTITPNVIHVTPWTPS